MQTLTSSGEGTTRSISPCRATKPLVLVVEANQAMATFIVSIIAREYRVVHAFTGSAGIRKALRHMPDLILADVLLPQTNGFCLCQTLKQHPLTRHIPIILSSVRATPADRLRGLRHGADVYLAKPFHYEELLLRSAQLIELRQQLNASHTRYPRQRQTTLPLNDQSTLLDQVHRLVLDCLHDPDFDYHALYATLNVSRTKLYRKLKTHTGYSPGRYIRAMRLSVARQLLEETSLLVFEVAYRVGFKDANYFSTCFREEFGLPPRSLRSLRER